MRNHGEHECLVCGKVFEYCRKCALVPVKHFAEGFCSEVCADIHHILSKHGCNLATAEETLEALKDYDVSNVSDSIQTHINSLRPTKKKQKNETEADA